MGAAGGGAEPGGRTSEFFAGYGILTASDRKRIRAIPSSAGVICNNRYFLRVGVFTTIKLEGWGLGKPVCKSVGLLCISPSCVAPDKSG